MSSHQRTDNDQNDHRSRPLATICGTPLEIPLFLPLALKLCEALAVSHRQGVVHGSISPHCILIDPAGEVSLTCLSSAPHLPHTPGGALDLCEKKVLPAYMSPEQTGRMNRPIDQRSDLYSLGVVFYQLLTGQLPFKAADLMEWVHCHLAHPVRPPAELLPQIPVAVSDIVVKLLAKSCEERYQSADGVAADLRRCHSQLQAGGSIPPFALGTDDVSERLLLPYHLIGRAAERTALMEALRRMLCGAGMEVVMVSGPDGIGKTALVLELYRPVLSRGGFFVTGKFDPLRKEVPYRTVAEAFRAPVRQILSESEERVARWQQRLQEALGANARLMLDLIPQLERVMGPQPEVEQLPPAQARNRFHLAFRQLLCAFASADHPLVVFLDDLQWADPASLTLIEHLLSRPEVQYILFIGAYRDSEAAAGHPLAGCLKALSGAGVALRCITLGPLSQQEVGALLSEALCSDDPARCDSLTETVYQKTGGNPFFVTQFLSALQQEGLLAFDHSRKKWGWDAAAIRKKGYTDNVVELMARKLKKLSEAAQEEMRLVSCIGSRVDVSTCALVSGMPEEEARSTLEQAVHEGLLVAVNGDYAFLHDRVQEAAYALVPQEQRAVLHLKIGRLMVTRLCAEALEERIFEVVNQLNRGAHLVSDPREMESLSVLNAAAGRKAKAAVAFEAAAGYLQKAVTLLPERRWQSSYPDTFTLFLDLAECHYLNGAFGEAEKLFALLFERARSHHDQVRVLRQKGRLYHLTGRFSDALAITLEALEILGVSLPKGEEALLHAFAEEMEEIEDALSGHTVAGLSQAPQATDPHGALLVGVLVDGLTAAYAAASAYFPVFAAKGVRYSVKYGNTADSCIAYGSYAVTMIAVFGEIETAVQFSEMALTLARHYQEPRMQGLVLFCHAGLVAPWRRHMGATLPQLEQSIATLLASGAFVECGHALMAGLWAVLESAGTLEQVSGCARKYRGIAVNIHNDTIHTTLGVALQFAASLKGSTAAPASFDDEGFHEREVLSAFADSSWEAGLAYFHVLKLVSAVVYRRFELAHEAALVAEPALSLMMAMPAAATLTFFQALTVAALLPKRPANEQKRSIGVLAALLAKLKRWAEHAPENYAHRHALVAAELARAEGRDLDAERCYEEAVASARANGFLLHEALALEFAAGFYRGRSLERVARCFLFEARDCYGRYGAEGKVRQLEERDPWLRRVERSSAGAQLRQIDAIAALKGAQAISAEIVLDRMLETLMRIAMQNAGAQRGALLLVRDDTLNLELLALMDGERLRTERPAREPLAGQLPLAMVNYVRRSGERIILDDAANHGAYLDDPYVARQRPLSVLCLPIVRQSRLVGILYLENSAASGAFTEERAAVLEILAGQAAISLENALLYTEVQQENRERRQAEEKFRALVENAPDAMVIVNETGQIAAVNAQADSLFGYTREELVGREVEILLPEQLRERHVGLRNAYLAAPQLRTIGERSELYARHKDGRVFPVHISLGPIATQSGVLVTATVRDITDIRLNQEALRESEQRYRELNATLEERITLAVDESTRKNRILLVQNRQAIIGEMLSTIAHQWRQPLNSIGLIAQELQVKSRMGELDSKDLDSGVQRMMHILQQLSKTIDDFGFFFRPSEEKVAFRILDSLGATLSLLKDSFEAYRIKTRVHASGDPELVGYPADFSQVLLNILLNAKDALVSRLVPDPQITIEVRREGTQSLVSVTDNAGGVAEDLLERIFEPYFTTKGPEQGTGVGLYMCKTIVEKNMNGVLEVRNVPGGARFTIKV